MSASSASPPTDRLAPTADGITPPWLSVLIPVYNVQDYLRECVESVLSQADHGVEVLMVDDCSTDGSAALMRQLAARDPRVRCLFHEQNQGLSGARNTLLQAATGDYVWFLDSDDYLMPGALPGLRALAERHAPALVMCDFRMVRTPMKRKHRWRGELHKRTFFGPERELLNDRSMLFIGLFEAGQMHSWSKIAKRSVWGDQLRFPVGRYFEDMGTTPFLALLAQNYWYEPSVWVAYRQREGSILHTPNLKKAEHLAHALSGLREAAAKASLSSAAKFAWAHFAARNFISAARMAHRAEPAGCSGLIGHYRAEFERASPISLRELELSYLRRGWWIRALRLRHWLARADVSKVRSAA
ncbi:glycosyltransferase family 2 protein [Roseateles amylovorans]|uniref:Glycosyltransferase n=1 Tax=Roseateles amylovorans TaxID=2978473 RepID=A0ABY6AZD9_9BURK|nr:glycosyltransferase family 2 protein [Roseateles amylovorans]UXH76668.1 glycosyltransferase [Roseateles amylovorans]